MPSFAHGCPAGVALKDLHPIPIVLDDAATDVAARCVTNDAPKAVAPPPASGLQARPTPVPVLAPEGEQPEAGIFSILSQYAVMQVVLAFAALVRNKVVALRLGPSAFGEISQIGAVVALVVTLVSFGMGVSLSRNVAKSQKLQERQSHLANANGIVLALSFVAVPVTLGLLVAGDFLRLAGLTESPLTVLTAALFIAGVPFIGLQRNYIALLQGILDIRGLAVQRSVAVLLATVVSVPVVWFFGFVGAAVQFLGLNLLVTLLLGWRCRSLGYAPLAVRLDGREVLLLASFGLMSMASGFAQGVSDTAVRTQLIDMAGAAANGLLQAPYALTMTVNSIVLASIGSVALATIAPKSDPGEISDAIDRLLSVVVPLGAAALGLLGLLGVPAIAILYSKAFTSGAAFLPYLLAADLLFVFVWVIGAPLLAGDRLLWFSLELIQAAARWAIALLLLPHLGGLAVVIGFLAAVALHVALNLAVFRVRYGLHLATKHVYRLLVGLAFVAFLAFTGAHAGVSIPAMSAALALWLAYAAYHVRRTGIVASLQRHFQPD